jgi:Cu(I)/Ag(I) efflux system membrane fusion protein
MSLKLFLLLFSLVVFAKEPSVEQLFSVQTIKVKKQSIQTKLKSYGYVKADDSRKFSVCPRFGGYVVKLYANKIYQRVKKGEALVSVYSPEILKAKSEYLNTSNYTKKLSSLSMLGSAKLKLKLLGISNREINNIVKKKRVTPNTTIYSPIDGYIFTKNIQNGSAFNAKDVLFEILNLDSVWVELKLLEEQRKSIISTNEYELKFKGLDKIYYSKNKFLYPELDPKIATLTMRLQVENKDKKLFPGMYASVISKQNANTYLTLPSTAVIRKGGKYYVFIVSEYKGIYEPLEVKVKVLDANTYAILSGLTQNDEVVNNALFMMDSDAQINSLY